MRVVRIAVAMAITAVAMLEASPAQAAPATPAPYQAPGPALESKRKPERLLPSQFAAVVNPRQLAGSTRRHLVLRAGRLEQMTGATVVWSGALSAAGTPQLTDLYRLVQRSPNPTWLTQLSPGVFLLRAGLVQAPGTKLTIAAPGVRELRLLSTGKVGEEVYLTGVAARVSISGTAVTSWLPGGGPDRRASLRRPFVTYDQPGAAITAEDARFSYLGGDSVLGYGVTWGRGSTGSTVGSTFDHNFFGAYTNAAVGVAFRRNTFRDNDLYGLDPHTSSKKLIVDRNVAYGNGSHGIIFSEDVVDSSVTNNRSYRNKINGIMMDERSDRNVVSGNETFDNAGDGIVVQGSSRVIVRDNTITDNRVGVRVGGDSVGNEVSGNRLVGNERGIEMFAGPTAAAAIKAPNVVLRNDIEGAGLRYGVAVKDFAGVRVVSNTIRRHVDGILVTGVSPHASIVSNRLTAHTRGIEVDAMAPGARLTSNTVENATERGLVLAGPNAVSQNDKVTGADIGVDVRAAVSVTGVTITEGRRGINLVSGHAVVRDATINVREYGVAVDPGTTVDLQKSVIVADHPVVGTTVSTTAGNDLRTPPPPLEWLAVAGAVFLLLAVALYLFNRRRSPVCYERTDAVPAGVRNAW